MSFIEKCICDSLPVWEACLDTPFLKGMADGSLDRELFKGYIVDDSLYLREYAKVFGWGIVHSRTMEDVRRLHSLLGFVNESEDSARLVWLERFGLSDGEIQCLPLRRQNREYVDTMIAAARDGGYMAYCMAACLPCMLSYLWIFRELLKKHPYAADGIYGTIIGDYVSDSYAKLCSEWTDFAEELFEKLNDIQKTECRELFLKCSRHEFDFWIMCSEARDDI